MELIQLLGTTVKVIIDRQINTKHPKHKDIIYECNYGYITSLIAKDNEYQDAYVLGVDYPISKIKGKVIAIINRLDDIEDKLVVSVNDLDYSIEEIEEIVNFQEKYFKHVIIK